MARSTTQKNRYRSQCPINLTLEILGDRWSLIVIRDIIFGNWRHFRDLLNNSLEGISSNTLAERLKSLEKAGIISRADDPSHKQKVTYSLTEQGIELLPLLAHASNWGLKYRPVSKELAARARVLADGGPSLWQEFMCELREQHLGVKQRKRRRKGSVRERMQAAYEEIARDAT